MSLAEKKRLQRFMSHALVEVRRYKWLPFYINSAILLDISLQGFKLEFTGEFNAKIGKNYWITIPLTPLGIYAPTTLSCLTQCRWFDNKRYRIGGQFIGLSRHQTIIVEQVISTLRDRGTDKL
jgi:hypothetical protein